MSEHTHPSFDIKLSATGFRFAIVVSRFNSFVTDRLVAGAGATSGSVIVAPEIKV